MRAGIILAVIFLLQGCATDNGNLNTGTTKNYNPTMNSNNDHMYRSPPTSALSNAGLVGR